jgi:hypothetical protein
MPSAAEPNKRLRSDGLDNETVARSVEAALQTSLGKGASDADVDVRVRAATSRNEAFATKYPKLLRMACAATTRASQDDVRRFLRLMLDQVNEVERGGALDDATLVVGQAMADRYLPQSARE